MAIGLVFNMVREVAVFKRGFISAFLQKAGKEEVAKEQMHVDVSKGATVGDTIFSFYCDIAS